jgi:hypothetical protein
VDRSSREAVGNRLLEALQDNSSLTTLVLCLRCLSPAAASTASNWFKSSYCALHELDLGGTSLGDTGATFIAEGLKSNRTVQLLGARGCRISESGTAAPPFVMQLQYVDRMIFLNYHWQEDADLAKASNIQTRIRVCINSVDLMTLNMACDSAIEG